MRSKETTMAEQSIEDGGYTSSLADSKSEEKKRREKLEKKLKAKKEGKGGK
jgi:hypothetical protein